MQNLQVRIKKPRPLSSTVAIQPPFSVNNRILLLQQQTFPNRTMRLGKLQPFTKHPFTIPSFSNNFAMRQKKCFNQIRFCQKKIVYIYFKNGNFPATSTASSTLTRTLINGDPFTKQIALLIIFHMPPLRPMYLFWGLAIRDDGNMLRFNQY